MFTANKITPSKMGLGDVKAITGTSLNTPARFEGFVHVQINKERNQDKPYFHILIEQPTKFNQ